LCCGLDSFTNNNSSSSLLASLEENDFSYPPNIDSKNMTLGLALPFSQIQIPEQ
jgi:hypothetical protein